MENDIILSAICIADKPESESIKISSSDEKLKWWKLDYVGDRLFLDTCRG